MSYGSVKAGERGQLALQVLIFGSIAVIFLAGFLTWSDSVVKSVVRYNDRALAISIAEAGIEYYRWHLAHSPGDYQDGTGNPGPYIHDYTDKNGNLIGQFSLEITPPPVGSTVVEIISAGTVVSDPTISKKIKVKLGIPSFAKYAAVLNADVRFGEGTEIFGEIHSNGGVRVDGIAHNIVSSAQSVYNDPDHSNNNEFGVHTHKNTPPLTGINENFRDAEAPPNSVPDRSDVFLAGRQFPVPAVDFAGITADLTQIKTDAQAGGRYFADSGAKGYRINLKTNDTFDLYTVNSTVPVPNGCTSVVGQQDWGTWSIESETLLGNYNFPNNGLIFIEDDVWIEGQINTARITIGSARFPDNPAQRTAITVNNSLLYSNYDGQDAIALISQGNFNVGFVSQDVIRIDAALLAQNGRIGRYYYRPPTGGQDRCSPYHIRQTITLYGMMMSNQRYGFAYTDGTGYQNRYIIYDPNLLYSPPPSFPLTTDPYRIISWEEI